MTSVSFDHIYTSGEYLQDHPDWHLGDAPNKALDVLAGLMAAIADRPDPTAPFRLLDVGAGVGGVLDAALKLLARQSPALKIEPLALEISPQAVAKARELFPQLPIRQEALSPSSGQFDALMLIDVLEHLENPWELLRTVAQCATHLIVRQPLLESFAMFRHDAYKSQRETWGHIGLFNVRSFDDMLLACGWKPLKVSLLAPWELHGNLNGGRWLPRMLVRANRLLASQFISGFYLCGAYRRQKSDDATHLSQSPSNV